jgi:hypothetical protein
MTLDHYYGENNLLDLARFTNYQFNLTYIVFKEYTCLHHD